MFRPPELIVPCSSRRGPATPRPGEPARHVSNCATHSSPTTASEFSSIMKGYPSWSARDIPSLFPPAYPRFESFRGRAGSRSRPAGGTRQVVIPRAVVHHNHSRFSRSHPEIVSRARGPSPGAVPVDENNREAGSRSHFIVQLLLFVRFHDLFMIRFRCKDQLHPLMPQNPAIKNTVTDGRMPEIPGIRGIKSTHGIGTGDFCCEDLEDCFDRCFFRYLRFHISLRE